MYRPSSTARPVHKNKHKMRRGVFKAELPSEALKTQKKLVFKGGLCRRAPASRHSRQKRILTIDGLLPPRQEVDSDTRKSRVKRDHSLSDPQKLLKIRYMAPTYYCRGDNQGWPKRPETRPPQAPSRYLWIYTGLTITPFENRRSSRAKARR